MQRFDKFNSEQNGASDVSEPTHTVGNGTKTSNGDISDMSNHKRSPPDDESVLSGPDENPPPKKKNKKTKVKDEDDDAAFAARLQAEENARMGRATRGGNTKRKAPAPKKKAKKKSANKVKDDDDSDIGSGSGGEKKSPSRKGGFHVSLISYIFFFFVTRTKDLTHLTPFRRNQWPSPQPCPNSSAKHNSRGPRQSRRFGNTSRRATCKTQTTSARSAAMTLCALSSSKTVSTCLP